MSHDEHEITPERVFSLSEANQLIPQLQTHLTIVQQRKSILLQTYKEARKASANALYGGGTTAGSRYVNSLKDISSSLRAIHEMGVVVKDIDMGLCDFPHIRDGRIVYLCWKLGEQEIRWWHEVTRGYKDRCRIDDPPSLNL